MIGAGVAREEPWRCALPAQEPEGDYEGVHVHKGQVGHGLGSLLSEAQIHSSGKMESNLPTPPPPRMLLRSQVFSGILAPEMAPPCGQTQKSKETELVCLNHDICACRQLLYLSIFCGYNKISKAGFFINQERFDLAHSLGSWKLRWTYLSCFC